MRGDHLCPIEKWFRCVYSVFRLCFFFFSFTIMKGRAMCIRHSDGMLQRSLGRISNSRRPNTTATKSKNKWIASHRISARESDVGTRLEEMNLNVTLTKYNLHQRCTVRGQSALTILQTTQYTMCARALAHTNGSMAFSLNRIVHLSSAVFEFHS